MFILGCSTDDSPGSAPEPNPGEELLAVDDVMNAVENGETLLPDLLANDNVVDRARITSVDAETTEGGTVVRNSNGTYSYFPPNDFQGEDSFSYTICVPGDSSRCSSAEVIVTVGDAGEPTAVDDSYQTAEEEELVIQGHLANDTVIDNAVVTSVVSDSGNANVTLEADGSIKYVPNDGFSGEDSFIYTLCDDDEDPNCSTATITITVVDEGAPVAVNDKVVVEVGATGIVLANLLENDNLLDDAVLTSIDASGSTGTLVLNEDGTVTYSAASGFKGEDNFTYTICDDDETPECSEATVSVLVVETVAFNIPAELQDYYSGATLAVDENILKSELAYLTEEEHVNKLEYPRRHDYLYDADASLSDPEYVVLMYTGELRPWTEYQDGELSAGETFNTEHIYPQSRLASQEAKNDMHHMRVADITVNETRSNYPFVAGSGDAKLVNGNSWYPGDEWKGDVARMVMYVHLKYGEPFSDVGDLDLFLKWNAEDPVSALELQRQEIIEGAQGNRNPFIDNPYFATLLWDGPAAENRWE